MEQEDVDDIIAMTLAQWMGRTLFSGQVDKAKREILAMMSASVARGMLPAEFRLMQATSTFALYSHLTPGDSEDLLVKQARVWSKVRKGGIVLDSSTEVICINRVYDKHGSIQTLLQCRMVGPRSLKEWARLHTLTL